MEETFDEINDFCAEGSSYGSSSAQKMNGKVYEETTDQVSEETDPLKTPMINKMVSDLTTIAITSGKYVSNNGKKSSAGDFFRRFCHSSGTFTKRTLLWGFVGLVTTEFAAQQLNKSCDPTISLLAFTPPSVLLDSATGKIVNGAVASGQYAANGWNMTIDLIKRLNLSVFIDPFINILTPFVRIVCAPLYVVKGFVEKISTYNYSPSVVFGSVLFFLTVAFAWEVIGVTRKSKCKPSNVLDFINRNVCAPIGNLSGEVLGYISSLPLELLKKLNCANIAVAGDNLIGSSLSLIKSAPQSFVLAYGNFVAKYRSPYVNKLLVVGGFLLLCGEILY